MTAPRTSRETDLRDAAFALDEQQFVDALEDYVRDRIAEHGEYRNEMVTWIIGAMLARADGRIEVTHKELHEATIVRMWREEYNDKVVMVAELPEAAVGRAARTTTT